MTLNKRIPSHLLIVALVFYQSIAVFSRWVSLFHIAYNTNKMVFFVNIMLFFISERASPTFVLWFLVPESNEPQRLLIPRVTRVATIATMETLRYFPWIKLQ